MSILKSFWKLLVGIKDFLVLLLMLIIFIGIIAVVNSEEEAPRIASSGALTVPMSGVLVSQKQEVDPFTILAGGTPVDELEVSELVRTIEAAAEDDRVTALVLDMDGFLGGGLANVQDVADAVAAFKSNGKPVHSFASAYLDDSWLIAAHGNEIWLDPLGAVFVQGFGGSQLYFADALEKLKIDVNVFRVGEFKSAVEPYTETEASPEAKMALQAVADDLWANYLQDAAAARPPANLSGYVEDMPGAVRSAQGDFAQAALASGLVDHVASRTEFESAMADLVGEDGDDLGLYVSTDYSVFRRDVLPDDSIGGGSAVGIVTVAGTIVDGEAPAGTAGGVTVSELIKQAASDGDIKALVLRVDSPGGSVFASEQIRQAVLAARVEGLPVVASFGPVAASGGYWIATGAETIIAEPTTITGSIGVFSVVPTFEGTLAELGISTDGVQTTPLSGAPDVFAGLEPVTEDLLQLSVEDIYRRFISIVAEAREMEPERVAEIAEGRIWSGGAARQLGLVDQFGDLADAIAVAEERAGFEPGDLRIVHIREPKPFAVEVLEDMFLDSTDAQEQTPSDAAHLAMTRQHLAAAASLDQALAMAKGSGVQALCLDCAPAPKAGERDLPGWLSALKSLFD